MEVTNIFKEERICAQGRYSCHSASVQGALTRKETEGFHPSWGKKKKRERTTPPNFVSLLNSILTRRKVVGLMHDTVEPDSSTKFFSKS